MMLPVAILAGGLATRLRPVTDKIPKALIETAGEPFISHQLKLLRKNDFKEVILCVGYLGEKIRDLIADGAEFDLHVEYSFDGPVLLGTGGAIRKALHLLGDAFLVLYGDSYLDCNYRMIQTAFEGCGKPAMMTVYKNEDRWGESNVLYSNGEIRLYDKRHHSPLMKHIDYGLGVFRRTVFEDLQPDAVCDLADVYMGLLSRNQLAGCEVLDRFYEIGSKEGLEELNGYLLSMKKE